MSQDVLRLSIIEGCFALVPATFTGTVFVTGFALLLHADAAVMAWVAALPALGQGMQLAGAAVVARGVARKPLCVAAASVGRYLWLPIAALPFLPWSDGLKLGVFLVLLGLSTASAQVGGVAWTSWMGDMVPAEIRGRYFGARNAINAVVGMLAVWGGSHLISAATSAGHEALGFAALIALATAGALASQALLTRQLAPPPAPPRPVVHAFRQALADRRFMAGALLLGAWNLIVNTTSPFLFPYVLQDLHWDFASLGTYTMLVAAYGVGAQVVWGRAIDRMGAGRALLWAMAPVVLHPLMWIVMTPDYQLTLWLDALSTGVFWSGITLGSLAWILEHAPPGEQAPYVAVFNATSGFAVALGAVLGGWFLQALGHAPLAIAGIALVPLQWLLWGALGLRVVCFAVAHGLLRGIGPRSLR